MTETDHTPPGQSPPGDGAGIVLALDVGTSSVRCLGFDARGDAVPELAAAHEHRPRATADGGSELDAAALLEAALDCLAQVSAAAAHAGLPLLGVGVCTFWHALLALDAEGRALTPLYLWNDMRAADAARELRDTLDAEAVHRRTGCVLHPAFLPARLLWLSRSEPGAFGKAALFGAFGELMEWRLFGARRTSPSMASGTGLLPLDPGTPAWDAELLAQIGVTPERLPALEPAHRPLRGLTGEMAARLPHLVDVPFFPALGDGACSNLGSGATRPGHGALMVGTSAALRVFHATPPQGPVPEGLWRYRLDVERMLTGGALSNGGNVVFWLQRLLRLPDDPHALDALLGEALRKGAQPGDHGLTVLPFLFGERNPDYPLDATGTILGLRGAHGPLDIARACLEAVAYRLAAIADRLAPAAPELEAWIASGGLLDMPHWMGTICDALGMPLVASTVKEASARGAALMALEGLGLLRNAHTLPAPLGQRIAPDRARHEAHRMAQERHEAAYKRWMGRE